MGMLIKNHWARLIILSAAAYQFAAAIECFLWPKIFWDFTTHVFDPAVGQRRGARETIHSYDGFPFLQLFNLLFACMTFAWEAPIKYIAGSRIQRSIPARFAIYPMSMFCSILIYQGTNCTFYYLIGLMMYAWAFVSGEQICAVPWTLPAKPSAREVETKGEPKQVAV